MPNYNRIPARQITRVPGIREWQKGAICITAVRTDWAGWTMMLDIGGRPTVAIPFEKKYGDAYWDCNEPGLLSEWGVGRWHEIRYKRIDSVFRAVLRCLHPPRLDDGRPAGYDPGHVPGT